MNTYYSIRFIYAGIFILLILTLLMCALNAKRHYKALGQAVFWLDLAFIPPILGNAIIIVARNKMMALVGNYIYFVGMDFVVYELMKFTEAYCKGNGRERIAPAWVQYLLLPIHCSF